MIRVPIFGILFLILGEWLPLIAIFFTPLLPYTCRIPSQVEAERRVIERRRKRSFRGEIDNNVPAPTLKNEDGDREVAKIEELSKVQLMHISRSLGLHVRLWDLSKGVLPPVPMLRWKVRRAGGYIDQDDTLLLRDGGIERLSDEEVRIACEERGIDIVGRDVKILKDVLHRWIQSRVERRSTLPKLLSRPEAWSDR